MNNENTSGSDDDLFYDAEDEIQADSPDTEVRGDREECDNNGT